MADIKPQRQAVYSQASVGYKGPMPTFGQNQIASYMPAGSNIRDLNMNVSSLANGLGGMNLHHGPYGNRSNAQVNAANGDYSGLTLPGAQGLWLAHPQVMYPNGVNQAHGLPHTPAVYAPVGPYLAQGSYSAYSQQTQDNSPLSQNWSSRVSSQEMPSLMTPRRDSVSSNEQDLPGTPSFGYGMYHNGVAVADRSPNAVFAQSNTPSPSQLTPYSMSQGPKTPITPTLSPKLLALLQKDPPIPRAIPAPSSPIKPLDRSLENKNGETNVYIRGLLPETTDEMLHSWGARFGDIQSSKSIIDLKTNLCKGFGFIKYHNFDDAENCIRGFHYLGYEVSFARESFYAKLKKFADEENTNLYISNIPKNFNEHELAGLFSPHEACSTRILRDPSTCVGRGVGFARFASRDVCEDVIKKFNNTTVKKDGQEFTIQIRYSDTHEQKMLKQQTAAGRQFRAAEYEVGVASVRGGTLYGQRRGTSSDDTSGDFESYMQSQSHGPAMSAYAYPQRFAQQNAARNWMARTTMPFMAGSRLTQSSIPPVNLPSIPVVSANGTATEDDGASAIKQDPSTPVKSTAAKSAPSAPESENE